jgi:hypothetical protein
LSFTHAVRDSKVRGTLLAAPFRTSAMRYSLLAVTLLLGSVSAFAQDTLTVGSVNAAAGATVQVPVYVRDAAGTTLGSDAGAGRLIGGYAFKVLYAPSRIASITFARAGVAAAPAPLFESTFSGTDYLSAVASFSETNPMSFTLNASAPGNQIGTLTVTLQPSIPNGTVIPLTLDAPSAMLSSQSSAERETIALGNLTVVDGSIVVGPLAAPANLVATANGTSQVSLTWSAVAGADHYEVERSYNGTAFGLIASPASASHIDLGVSAGTTYLYRVRAVSAASEFSGYSNRELATTILFTEDPVVAFSTTIKAVHFHELRTAVNAVRTAASLFPLPADPTVGVGQAVRAQHLTSLRTALDEARSAAGLSALAYTDAPPTLIKAVHVNELRAGVK